MSDAFIHQPGGPSPRMWATWNALKRVASGIADTIFTNTFDIISIPANQPSGTIMATYVYTNNKAPLVCTKLNFVFNFGGANGNYGAWYADGVQISSERAFWTTAWGDLPLSTPVSIDFGQSVTFTLRRTNTSPNTGSLNIPILTMFGLIND